MKLTMLAQESMVGCGDYQAVMFVVESPKYKTEESLADGLRKAIAEYVLTDDGKAFYESNGYNYNWGDFIDNADSPAIAPILKKHGIKVTYLGTALAGAGCVDLNEQLMN